MKSDGEKEEGDWLAGVEMNWLSLAGCEAGGKSNGEKAAKCQVRLLRVHSSREMGGMTSTQLETIFGVELHTFGGEFYPGILHK